MNLDDFPADALAFFEPFLQTATLTKRTYGALGATLTEGPAVTETDYVGKGCVSQWRKETTHLVKRNDNVVILLAASFSVVPAPQDKVAIEGVTYQITAVVERDAGAAAYVLAVR